MFADPTEILSSQEIAQMDSKEAAAIACDLLEKIRGESSKLAGEALPDIDSIIRSSGLLAAKVEYLRRRFVGVRGDTSLLSKEERGWMDGLDHALSEYMKSVIDGLERLFPNVLGNVAVEIIGAGKEAQFGPQHALIGLLAGIQEMKRLVSAGTHGLIRFTTLFLTSIFVAQQFFRMWKMGEKSMGGSDDLSKLPWVKQVIEYVGGGTVLATRLCSEMGVSPVGAPLITILEHDNPPLLCIEYLLDASPRLVCEANDKLSKSIAVNRLPIPDSFHICFGVA
ncbi:hypothetical protein ACSBPU_12750 [Parapusillimonas sp. JC17]|uniref:hypothetical protein n=1 Tax=Parapusillimonas sp. JC17 TaxID=3445768 RepID=UPI003FA16251